MERNEIMSICSRYGFNFIDVEDDEIVCHRDGLYYRISRNRFPGRLQEEIDEHYERYAEEIKV